MKDGFCNSLGRRKKINDEGSKLARVLTITDLTALGVGSTLGLGVYVLAGSVAKNEAGPAVCLSFLVAAIASGIAGLCYAEFASRVPKAGSAYIYSYVSVGEFAAFIIGWNLILEYVIGTASVARGLSGYLDNLMNDTMQKTLREAFPIDIDFLSPYPDFFAFFIVLLLAGILAIGVKESTTLNNIFTALNLITVCIVLVAGCIKADVGNWKIEKENIPPKFSESAGEGGFLPFGVAGVMAGAAKCFYGFVGFDCIATTGEEAKNPKKSIPISIIISLIIIFLAYFGISTVLTMMWPYYDQNENAPFPYVFDQVGWPVIKWIVSVGAVFALCTSLLGAMFPLPRILYAMSNDGLLFQIFSKVSAKSQTPVIATMSAGLLTGLMAAIFNLQQLIDMMSIGTLLAYTIVAICVLLLRYQPTSDDTFYPSIDVKDPEEIEENSTIWSFFKQLINLNMLKYPSKFSSSITVWSTYIFSCVAAVFCGIIIHFGHHVLNNDIYYVYPFAFATTMMVLIILVIARQPMSGLEVAFKVPWVPLLPCLSIIMNVYLMLELDLHTWVRFIVWLAIGFGIYFGYGISHSVEGVSTPQRFEIKMASFQRRKEVTKF